MVPHAVRLVIGPKHRLLLPASVLAGASALVLADLLARLVLAPVEIPVGIVTALAGGPFFVWLLVRKERVR
jgi:iron complex transport system permease protein